MHCVLCLFTECTKQPAVFQSNILWRLWDGHSALSVQTSYVLLFPACAKKALPCQIWLLLKGEKVWGALQAMESPWTKPDLWEEKEAHWFIFHNYMRNLGGNKHGLISWAKMQLGWWLFMELIILLNREASKLLFVELLKGYFALDVRTSCMLLFPGIEKNDFSCLIKTLCNGYNVLCVYQVLVTMCTEPVLREQEAAN